MCLFVPPDFALAFAAKPKRITRPAACARLGAWGGALGATGAGLTAGCGWLVDWLDICKKVSDLTIGKQHEMFFKTNYRVVSKMNGSWMMLNELSDSAIEAYLFNLTRWINYIHDDWMNHLDWIKLLLIAYNLEFQTLLSSLQKHQLSFYSLSQGGRLWPMLGIHWTR